MQGIHSRSRLVFVNVWTDCNSTSNNFIEEAEKQHDVNNVHVISGIVSANDNELMKKLIVLDTKRIWFR